MKFDLKLPWEDGEIRVTGSISRAIPATGPSMSNAGGDPPEPAEITDFQAYAADGSEIDDSDGAILDHFEDAIMEWDDDAMADAAEARADRNRDR